MRTISTASTSLYILIIVFIILPLTLAAQTLEEENAKMMSQMDTESFRGKVVLNKAIVMEHQLEPFRRRIRDKDGSYRMYLEPNTIQDLFDICERGNMTGMKKPEAVKRIELRSRKEITASNVVPIGIINMDAVLLSEEQVKDNIKAKSEGKSADAGTYEKFDFITAGLLQQEIFQGDVQFQLSKELLLSDNANEIRSISIDFLDGKGWQVFSLKENELIGHRFQSKGEVAIYIRLETERGSYISENVLQIKMIERIKPDIVEKVAGKDGKENGRLAENVWGAEFAVYNGCDGVLNKPIIIAEGFDVTNSNPCG